MYIYNFQSIFLRAVTSTTCPILSKRIWKRIVALNEYWDLLIMCSTWSCCSWYLDWCMLPMIGNTILTLVTTNVIVLFFTMYFVEESLLTGHLWLNWGLWVILSKESLEKGQVRHHSKDSRWSHHNLNGYSWISLLVLFL